MSGLSILQSILAFSAVQKRGCWEDVNLNACSKVKLASHISAFLVSLFFLWLVCCIIYTFHKRGSKPSGFGTQPKLVRLSTELRQSCHVLGISSPLTGMRGALEWHFPNMVGLVNWPALNHLRDGLCYISPLLPTSCYISLNKLITNL